MATYSGPPTTATAGQTVTAAFWNAEVRDLAAAFGAANSYTPTLSGFTAGNGTFVGKYIQVGSLVAFYASFTFGTTSAAATATPALSVPVTGTGVFYSLWARYVDASTANNYEAGQRGLSTGIVTYVISTNGLQATCTTTSPFTWTTGDQIVVGGVYEAA